MKLDVLSLIIWSMREIRHTFLMIQLYLRSTVHMHVNRLIVLLSNIFALLLVP